jgi:hypothetical protein
MARPKKDGLKVSYYMDASIVARLKEYCDDKGQSQTVALERILKEKFDAYDHEKGRKE